jgi:hypothetical protein
MCLCGGNSKESCTCSKNTSIDPVIIQFPTLIKAYPSRGKRIIEFECSVELEDTEKDIILQSALLKSADNFIKYGHLDIDHFSELGMMPAYYWLGIHNPEEYIVGLPLEVKNLGEGRTGIKGEIFSKAEFNPTKHRFDQLWKELQSGIAYKSSVFGYPSPHDTVEGGCGENSLGQIVCAGRYFVKSFDWRSTALTKNPVNKLIKNKVQIVSIKSFAAQLTSQLNISSTPDLNIYDRDALRWSFYSHMIDCCPCTECGNNITIMTMKQHFITCDNLDSRLADVYALATSELIKRPIY